MGGERTENIVQLAGKPRRLSGQLASPLARQRHIEVMAYAERCAPFGIHGVQCRRAGEALERRRVDAGHQKYDEFGYDRSTPPSRARPPSARAPWGVSR